MSPNRRLQAVATRRYKPLNVPLPGSFAGTRSQRSSPLSMNSVVANSGYCTRSPTSDSDLNLLSGLADRAGKHAVDMDAGKNKGDGQAAATVNFTPSSRESVGVNSEANLLKQFHFRMIMKAIGPLSGRWISNEAKPLSAASTLMSFVHIDIGEGEQTLKKYKAAEAATRGPVSNSFVADCTMITLPPCGSAS